MVGAAEKERLINETLAQLLAKDRAEIEQMLRDYRPPWVNLTHVWNAAQDHYYLQRRAHYHGPLRGWKKKSAKHCAVLVVVDRHHGKPIEIDPVKWGGYPDYWDFKRVFAVPYDELFRGRKSVIHGDALTYPGVADIIVNAVNAHYAALSTGVDDG